MKSSAASGRFAASLPDGKAGKDKPPSGQKIKSLTEPTRQASDLSGFASFEYLLSIRPFLPCYEHNRPGECCQAATVNAGEGLLIYGVIRPLYPNLEIQRKDEIWRMTHFIL